MVQLTRHPSFSGRLRNAGVTEVACHTSAEGEVVDGKRACSEDVLG